MIGYACGHFICKWVSPVVTVRIVVPFVVSYREHIGQDFPKVIFWQLHPETQNYFLLASHNC